MPTIRLSLMATLAIGMAATAPAQAAPILEFSGGGLAPVASDASLGWSFTTNQSFNVVALDAFDPTGLHGTVGQVRLYDSIGNVLASALVTASDPIVGGPTPFYSHAITPVSLAANSTYYIVEDMSFTTQLWFSVSGLTTDSAITYAGAVDAAGQGNNPVTDLNGQIYAPSYFGPNFDIDVPEPATWAMFLMGLGGIGFMMRRSRSNGAVATT
jgi:hypothetical protein